MGKTGRGNCGPRILKKSSSQMRPVATATRIFPIFPFRRAGSVSDRSGGADNSGRLRSRLALRNEIALRINAGPDKLTNGDPVRAMRERPMMDHLWAPWRLPYVTANKPAGDAGCFICRGLAEQEDRANLIVRRTVLSAA